MCSRPTSECNTSYRHHWRQQHRQSVVHEIKAGISASCIHCQTELLGFPPTATEHLKSNFILISLVPSRSRHRTYWPHNTGYHRFFHYKPFEFRWSPGVCVIRRAGYWIECDTSAVLYGIGARLPWKWHANTVIGPAPIHNRLFGPLALIFIYHFCWDAWPSARTRLFVNDDGRFSLNSTIEFTWQMSSSCSPASVP
jgi:hypothetical protein